MFDEFVSWFRYSTLIEKAIILALIAMLLIIVVALVDPENGRATRKTFCLDRGYDKYQISQKKFYCHNTSSGEIKKFSDPGKKKGTAEKDSWE